MLKAGLPIDDVGSALNPLAKLAIEQVAGPGGYDFYFDRDIVKDPARPAGYQYDPKTAETLKTIGRGLNLSPERLQHAATSIMGGTSTNILFLTDMVLGHTGAQTKRELKTEYIPVVSKFIGETEDWKSDFAQKQRNLMREIKDKKASLMSKSEFVSASMRGNTVDTKMNEDRIKATTVELQDLFKQLSDVNKGLKAVDDLSQAIKDKNPSVTRHLLKPPTLSGAN